MQILRYGDLVDVRWKNGGGITRTIAWATHGTRTVWRISRADVVENGAFSSFSGLERILTVVSETGMLLEHPGGALDAGPWQPVRFDGGLEVFSRLKDGALTDLNLMFDPCLCDGSVAVLRGPLDSIFAPREAGLTALHVLAGRPSFGKMRLDVGDTAFVDATARLELRPGDAVLEIGLRYLDQSSAITLSIAAR